MCGHHNLHSSAGMPQKVENRAKCAGMHGQFRFFDHYDGRRWHLEDCDDERHRSKRAIGHVGGVEHGYVGLPLLGELQR